MDNLNYESKSITLPCPCCGEQEASIRMHLYDSAVFTCSECDGEFSNEDVLCMLKAMKRWEKVLAWANTMPTFED